MVYNLKFYVISVRFLVWHDFIFLEFYWRSMAIMQWVLRGKILKCWKSNWGCRREFGWGNLGSFKPGMRLRRGKRRVWVNDLKSTKKEWASRGACKNEFHHVRGFQGLLSGFGTRVGRVFASKLAFALKKCTISFNHQIQLKTAL